MPTDFDNPVENLHIIDQNDQEVTIQDCNILCGDDENVYEYDKRYSMLKDFDGNITIEANQPLNPKVFGVDVARLPDTVDVQYIHFISARRHRKKRINKKWLKRYGANYIPKHCIGKGWELKTFTDGSFEFVNNKLETNEEKVNEN